MFEQNLERITQYLCAQLLQDEAKIAFRDLVHRPLPPYLWDYFNVILNPQMSGKIKIGNQVFDFTEGAANSEQVQQLKEALKNTWKLDQDELFHLLNLALRNRLNFILDPSTTVTSIIYDYREGKPLTGQRAKMSMDNLSKLLERWDPRIGNAVETVKPYLNTMASSEVKVDDLTRLLVSSVEKELVNKPIPSIEGSLLAMKSLLQMDPQRNESEDIDFTDSIVTMLTNRGLTSWIPAIQIERELTGSPLGIDMAVEALRRFHVYKENGLLGAEPEDLIHVADEVDSFTSFVEEVTK